VRRRLVTALVIAIALVVAWLAWWRPVGPRTGPVPVAIDDGWARSTPAAEGFDEARLRQAAARLLDGPYDVHAMLVERHGRLVAEYYQGGRDRSVYSLLSTRQRFGPTTRHDVRSIGKSVTALLYGIALAEHRVPAPSTPLSSVYPWLAGRAAANARRIRIADLLDMSSGLAWDEEHGPVNDELRLFWRRDLPGYVLDRAMATAPGTAFNYNGGGTALLADLIARGTGDDVERYAARRLFAPLGIRDWAWVKDVHGRPMAFNGLRLRPRDLLKIGRLAQDRGRWRGRAIVPAAWIDATWAPGLPTGVADFRYRGQWWAGTADVGGRRVDWHAGFGNGGQRLFVLPALDVVIVTTAGAYDALPTAIAVNRLPADVAAAVRDQSDTTARR
jgi:CubicO group peptidase (beta-lactamase class C family)